MGTIQFRCSDDLEAKFVAAAERVGVTPANLARAIFEKAFSQATTASEGEQVQASPHIYEPRTERLYARLTPSEYAGVKKRATAFGMTPYTWTARLIRVHLIKEPQLTQDETRVLREATRALNYVGRNLNQVAHALNMTMNARDKATVELIAEIDEKIGQTRDRVKAVLDQNLNRWGV